MLGKNNIKLRKEKQANKFYRYSIKNLRVGVASVAVVAGLSFASSTTVYGQTTEDMNNQISENDVQEFTEPQTIEEQEPSLSESPKPNTENTFENRTDLEANEDHAVADSTSQPIQNPVVDNSDSTIETQDLSRSLDEDQTISNEQDTVKTIGEEPTSNVESIEEVEPAGEALPSNNETEGLVHPTNEESTTNFETDERVGATNEGSVTNAEVQQNEPSRVSLANTEPGELITNHDEIGAEEVNQLQDTPIDSALPTSPQTSDIEDESMSNQTIEADAVANGYIFNATAATNASRTLSGTAYFSDLGNASTFQNGLTPVPDGTEIYMRWIDTDNAVSPVYVTRAQSEVDVNGDGVRGGDYAFDLREP